ncbi:N-acetyltransferase family protein [Nocardioides sp. P5_C9_2]
MWEEAYSDLIGAEILMERRRSRSLRVARWRENILVGDGRTWLARSHGDGGLVGFMSHGPGRDEARTNLPDLEVWALYVRAAVYGHGVGYALLSAALGSAPAYLWVLEGNDRAVAFYERQGFRLDGCTKSEQVGREHRMVRTTGEVR